MNPSTLILYRDRKGRYRWHLKAPNGNKIAREAHGPGFARPASRTKNIMAVAKALGWFLYDHNFPSPGNSRTFYIGKNPMLRIRNDDDK